MTVLRLSANQSAAGGLPVGDFSTLRLVTNMPYILEDAGLFS